MHVYVAEYVLSHYHIVLKNLGGDILTKYSWFKCGYNKRDFSLNFSDLLLMSSRYYVFKY